MNGPTIWRRAEGRARRTSKPPRSRARGMITVSIASHPKRSPGFGSSAGCQLMSVARVERRRSGRLAGGADGDLLDAGLGALEERLAMLLQGLAALVDRDRFLERDLAALEPLDDLLELFERLLERQVCDLRRGRRALSGIGCHRRGLEPRRGGGKPQPMGRAAPGSGRRDGRAASDR